MLGDKDPSGLLVEQSREQALAILGQLVIDPEIEAVLSNQACVEQDSQVATNPTLLSLDNQAQVANAQLPGFIEKLEQSQASRITQGLRLSSQAGRLGRMEQLRAQAFSTAFAGVFQAQIGITHV